MQAGILSTNEAAISDFVRVLQKGIKRVGAANPRILSYPEKNPFIAVALDDQQNRPHIAASRPDGSFVVLDGEIYNKAKLVSDLGKDLCAQTNDASMILDLYFLAGPDSLAKLDGSATVTIWDADKQELTICRDRYGQMSLFYSEHGDRFLWAVDLRTLLLLGVPKEVDAQALDFFLATGYFPAPWTGLTHVKKIPPAHTLSRRQVGTAEARPYWRATGHPKLEISTQETTERIQSLIEQSLRRRYEPGTKTGVLLSGGVDSTLLVGALTKLIDAEVESFTFHYSDYDGPFNETQLALEAANHFGVRHHVIEFSPYDLAEKLDQMVLAYEEPFTYGLHTYLLKDVVQNGISVLMTGLHGEWYASPRDLVVSKLRKLPLPYRAIGGALGRVLRDPSSNWSRRISDILFGAASGFPGPANVPVASDAIRRGLYQDPTRATGSHRIRSLMRSVGENLAGESDRDQIVLLIQRLFSAECCLKWYTCWGRAWNIQFRHPYLDNDLQEFVMRLKRHDRNKPEMRSVAARLMPQSMAYAPKISQTIPIHDWFRGSLLDLLRSRLAPDRLKQGGIFAPAAVHRLINEHLSGSANHEWLLWTILTTTVWQDIVLNSPTAASKG